jgi:hypothetical protein
MTAERRIGGGLRIVRARVALLMAATAALLVALALTGVAVPA